ncbi:MAG: 30S ribosomal protein S4e [Candidatus Diapherotrites archaeon]|uniref:Small ribosomal subunit protein eS4 n=1 Tax=Candidatus Iainarchaeum sp. TaxID=3101447 RepID=A0A8T4L964_9ARCH|nr:30S ribosomal protein S4e [Candidatus Diapherotrites archaeon]
MSSKGGRTTSKRLALPRVRTVIKKARTWAIRPSPGSHSQETAVPLGSVLRDVLGVTTNALETRRVLSTGTVFVNSKKRKERKFAVGLFDVVYLETAKKYYRMVLNGRGRLVPLEITKDDGKFSVEKVTKKVLSKGHLFQLTTNAGSTFMQKDGKVPVGASLKVDLEHRKIVDTFEMKEGHLAYIVGGTHRGSVATIENISPSTMQKESLVSLKGDSEFQTITENVFVIGNKKAAIAVEKE